MEHDVPDAQERASKWALRVTLLIIAAVVTMLFLPPTEAMFKARVGDGQSVPVTSEHKLF